MQMSLRVHSHCQVSNVLNATVFNVGVVFIIEHRVRDTFSFIEQTVRMLQKARVNVANLRHQ